MAISFKLSQSSRYAGFSVGLYRADSGNDMPFSRNPLVISENGNMDGLVTGTILRDIDFSFALLYGGDFKIGLFLFDSNVISYQEIKNHYAKSSQKLPENSHYFCDMGVYSIRFDFQTVHREDDHHFMVKCANSVGKHIVKFTFYSMILPYEEHANTYRNMGVGKDSKESLYYISNPMVEFHPDEVF